MVAHDLGTLLLIMELEDDELGGDTQRPRHPFGLANRGDSPGWENGACRKEVPYSLLDDHYGAGGVVQIGRGLPVNPGQETIQDEDEHHRQCHPDRAQEQTHLVLEQVALREGHLSTPSWALALSVPLFAPLLHLLDLPLLGAHDVACELLYLGDLALLGGYLGHLYGRPVVRDHGVYESLVEGFPLRQSLRVHHYAHSSHLFRAHLHGHVGGAKLLFLDRFELLYLRLLGRDDVPGELLYLLVLSVLESDLGHGYGALVVGYHRVDERPVGVFAVLHDHLLGHSLGAHAHRPVAHLSVVHLAVAAAPGLVTFLTTPCATAGS